MIKDIKILPPDAEAMVRAKKRWDAVSKPKNSLGDFEELIVRIAGAQGTENIDISRRTVVVFAADNGIIAERIAQSSRTSRRELPFISRAGAAISTSWARLPGAM